jgi:magnesium transporter
MARKHRLYSGQSRKAGLPPGTLVHIGEVRSGGAAIDVTIYSPDGVKEFRPEGFDQCLLPSPESVTWVNLEGLQDVDLIRRFGECYKLHPLVLEDIVNTTQRPKIDDYGDYIFIVARMISFNQEQGIESEQVSMIVGPNYLLSFQEGTAGDAFEPVRERIRSGRGRIRTLGADYLAYGLIDAIVDNYFTVLEGMGEIVEDLEEELAKGPTQLILRKIIALKREIIFMRKGVWPLREVTAALERGESSLICDTSRIFFRDTYDHTIQVIDGVETFRDLLSGMLDLYMSSMSNRTNEIMKFLTVVGTIFLPLTFIVGVYGMNFKYIPELEWRYGYFIIWGAMLAIAAAMVMFFRKKRWL